MTERTKPSAVFTHDEINRNLSAGYTLMVDAFRRHNLDPEVVLERIAHHYLLAASANFTLAGRVWLDLGQDLLQTAQLIREGVPNGEDAPSNG